MVLFAVSHSVSGQVATRFYIFPVPYPLFSVQATAGRDSGIVRMTTTCAACRQQQRYCDDCQPIAVSSNGAVNSGNYSVSGKKQKINIIQRARAGEDAGHQWMSSLANQQESNTKENINLPKRITNLLAEKLKLRTPRGGTICWAMYNLSSTQPKRNCVARRKSLKNRKVCAWCYQTSDAVLPHDHDDSGVCTWRRQVQDSLELRNLYATVNWGSELSFCSLYSFSEAELE